MKRWLALALVLPMFIMSGCGGGKGAPALTEPGKDPPAEQQKNWQEESRSRGGVPKNVKQAKPPAEKPAEEKK